MESKFAESKMDENAWMIQIREGLEHFHEDSKLELGTASVFSVPKDLLLMKPQAYIPQAVSIGPYHHWKPELYDIERYKVAAARRAQKRLNGPKQFDLVVKEFRGLDWRIRSCYDKYLAYQGETLAWLMALDACFVLERLQHLVDAQERLQIDAEFLKQFGPRGSASHNSVTRDLMMLENQIPLFLLEKLLEMQCDSKHTADQKLCILASQACRQLSPFKFALSEISTSSVKERAHLLELLYYALLPSVPRQDDDIPVQQNEPTPSVEAESVKQTLGSLWTALSSLNVGPVQHLLRLGLRVLEEKPVKLIMKLPWRSLSSLGSLPILRQLKGPLSYVFNLKEDDATKTMDEPAGSSSQWIDPSPEELAVPSVSDLYYAGVKFAPTHGDLTTIFFDQKTATVYLPAITLDGTTEVILRNLIAFESCAAAGASVLRRYTDFLNGMVDTEEDVRLLRKSGIIHSNLRSDRDVASMWNSLGKCNVLSKVPHVDRAIADINKYYETRWKVAVTRYANKHVFRLWKSLTLLALAAFLLLALTFLQTFCSVYECHKWIGNNISIQK